VVCPGAVDTPMIKNASRLNGDLYALKRIARPEEIATAIAFLLGTDASYVTGIILPVDGGRTYY
jgi:NAD(P)-dependent dehydrogenase (short-subunit alcohol dehydrogenase family)